MIQYTEHAGNNGLSQARDLWHLFSKSQKEPLVHTCYRRPCLHAILLTFCKIIAQKSYKLLQSLLAHSKDIYSTSEQCYDVNIV